MGSMVSASRELHHFEVNAWAETFCEKYIPKITFPPETVQDPSVFEEGTPLFRLQQKVNKIMRGIIPFVDLSLGAKLPVGFHVFKFRPCIFWHDDLPQYVLKATGNEPGTIRTKVGRVLAKDDVMGRVPMAASLREVVKEHNLDRLYVVQKHLLTLPTDTWRKVNYERMYPIPEKYKYIVAAEKMDLTDEKETRDHIGRMDRENQKVLVRQLFELFYLSGFQNGHFWNFAFAKSGPQQGKLVLYDTESVGLVERHQASFEADPKLRQFDLSCGEFAMQQALDPHNGLFFDQEIKQEIYNECKEKIRKERENYKNAETYLKVLYHLPVVPLAAALIFQRIYPI